MALVTLTYPLLDGTLALGSEVKSDLDSIVNQVNGNLQNINVAANAAIIDTKLATISTTGKVNGTALANLDDTPSGAGIIPVANIDTGTTANKIVILDGSAKLPAIDGSQLINLPNTSVPSIFSAFGGNGAQGSQTISADTNFSTIDSSSVGIAQFIDLTVNNTKVLTIDTSYAYIGVSGTLTITGTITVSPMALPYSDRLVVLDATGGVTGGNRIALGGGGGGGGGGQGTGTNPGFKGEDAGGLGGAGGAAGVHNGSDGSSIPATNALMATGGLGDNATHITFIKPDFLCGGGRGGTAGASNIYRDGGLGGGVLYIECNELVHTGAITANGNNGTAIAGQYYGGSGGGGGGVVIIRATTITTNSGTVTVTGGTGTTGNSSGNGGNGGAGFKDIVEIS